MKILDLPLKKQWYDMIANGTKREEYRAIKPFWEKRLINDDGTFKDYTHVRFRYGYTKKTMLFKIENICIGRGNPEWGAPDFNVFIIKFTDETL